MLPSKELNCIYPGHLVFFSLFAYSIRTASHWLFKRQSSSITTLVWFVTSGTRGWILFDPWVSGFLN